MDTKAFTFNSSAKYWAGGHFKEKKSATGASILSIMVDENGSHFLAKFPDVIDDYQYPPFTGDVTMANKAWDNWQQAPFSWWQCLLNFAVWCATAGCGVSFEDHLQAEKHPLLASLYHFHVYYTTRHLLEELKVPLPGDKPYSWYENSFDARAYKWLCDEFSVSPGTDWRQKLDHWALGLVSWSSFKRLSEDIGAVAKDWMAWTEEEHFLGHLKVLWDSLNRHPPGSKGPFINPKDAIRHNWDISGIWTRFMLDKSEGFMQAGVERLNDSIQTYVWAILGSQAQTSSNTPKPGTGFDTQQQFLVN